MSYNIRSNSNNPSPSPEDARSISNSDRTSSSSSQTTLNYWQSHRFGLTPGVELPNADVGSLLRQSNNQQQRRNYIRQLAADRRTCSYGNHNRNSYKTSMKDGVLRQYLQEGTLPKMKKTVLEDDERQPQKSDSYNIVKKNHNSRRDVNGDAHSNTTQPNQQQQQPIHTQSSVYFILFLTSFICAVSIIPSSSTTDMMTSPSKSCKIGRSCLIISTILSIVAAIGLKWPRTDHI